MDSFSKGSIEAFLLEKGIVAKVFDYHDKEYGHISYGTVIIETYADYKTVCDLLDPYRPMGIELNVQQPEYERFLTLKVCFCFGPAVKGCLIHDK